MLIVGLNGFTILSYCVGFAFIFQVSTKPREICTKCFERLVSNILQGDKMLHFAYFICFFYFNTLKQRVKFVIIAMDMAWMEE
jgi:hypothetical protein